MEEEMRFRELACKAVFEAVEGSAEVPIQKLEENLVAAARRVDHSTLAARSKAARQPSQAEQDAKWTWKSAFGDHRPECFATEVGERQAEEGVEDEEGAAGNEEW
eukprot:14137940-Heterocapsa_arctica.AAC.1